MIFHVRLILHERSVYNGRHFAAYVILFLSFRLHIAFTQVKTPSISASAVQVYINHIPTCISYLGNTSSAFKTVAVIATQVERVHDAAMINPHKILDAEKSREEP